jgi:uncharacterized membrane protein
MKKNLKISFLNWGRLFAPFLLVFFSVFAYHFSMNWILFALISAVFLALKKVLIKQELFLIDPLPLLLLISLSSAFFSFLFINPQNIFLSPSLFGFLALKGFMIAISWYAISQAYKNLPISTVAPLENLAPLFLVILSFCILGEKDLPLQYFGIILLLFSAYILELKNISDFFRPLQRFQNIFFGYILLSLLTSAFSAIIDKHIIYDSEKFLLLFWFYVFLSLFYFVFLMFSSRRSLFFSLFQKKTLVSIFLIALLAVLSDYFYFTAVAIPGTLIVLIIPLRRLANVFATVLGGSFFKEDRFWYKGGVALLMVLGAILMSV